MTAATAPTSERILSGAEQKLHALAYAETHRRTVQLQRRVRREFASSRERIRAILTDLSACVHEAQILVDNSRI